MFLVPRICTNRKRGTTALIHIFPPFLQQNFTKITNVPHSIRGFSSAAYLDLSLLCVKRRRRSQTETPAAPSARAEPRTGKSPRRRPGVEQEASGRRRAGVVGRVEAL
jgi:hypothetical protein